MIHFDQLCSFVCGMIVVYMMFRAMGVFAFILVVSLVQSATAQSVGITNWPTSSSPLPVCFTDDVWPSCAMGFGFGLTVCGFGWVYRFSKRVGGYHD